MVSPETPDLAQLIQRRELSAHEQRLARASYAYGVDLRRSHWLDDSSLGEPVMRTVDRRWGALIEELSVEVFAAPDALPGWLLEETAASAKLLRAPLPTARAISNPPPASVSWPAVTPLGTTKGAMDWLVLDVSALSAMTPAVRRFALTAGVAHLQCEHGPLFTAHFMARRSRWTLGVVRRLLAPWTRVAVFSADRAGLLTTPDLADALVGIRAQLPTANVGWWPRFPSFEARERALQDFEHAAVVARARQRHGTNGSDDPTAARNGAEPGPEPPKYWSLARCDERLTRRLGLF